MRRAIFLIIIVLTAVNIYAQESVNIMTDHNVSIKIPSAWIERLQKFNYTRDDSTLIQEFESFLAPDTLVNPHWQHIDPGYGRVFNTMLVDLDGDATNEILAVIGWDVSCPYLCVFKQKQGNWYLIYLEEIDTFYSTPTLSVANAFSKNKPFYLRRVYEHGSGIYIDGYTFYKLINNKVYRCLDLINDAHIYGWGLYMNQAVKMSFEFSGDDDDDLWVGYNYDFFPGSLNKDNVSLLKDDASVSYKWDDKDLKYKLNIPAYQNQISDLTAAKISCFGAFGNDTLFVTAFDRQIKEVLKNGTKQQKKLLKRYLTLVKKKGKAVTQEMVKTAEAGGTSFYRPKE